MTDLSHAAEAIGAASSTDPEIKARIKAIAIMVLDEVEDVLANGAPMTKAQMMRSFLPILTRSLQDKKESEEIAELKREMEALRGEIREAAFPEGEIVRVIVKEDRPNGN